MSDLYKFLKRNSPLFVPRYGRSNRIHEHYSKFLCDRYGVVRHYYNPSIEIGKIEPDLKKLLDERFEDKKFEQLLNPPNEFI